MTTNYTPFTRHNQLSNRWQPVVQLVWQPVWQPCWTNSHCSFNQLSTVLNEQSVRLLSNRLYNPVWQPCWTNSCSFNRLANWVVQPVWQPAVYTIQPFVKPVVKQVWQPVECLYTRYNRFDNGFDNRLYRVYKHLPGCQTGLTTGLTTGCIV